MRSLIRLTMSDGWKERLERVIPGGAHTYSKGSDQYPANAPEILTHGVGPYVFDNAGTRFLDYGMGLRSVTLGYANAAVIKAAHQAMSLGNNLSKSTTLELEAAERFIDLIPSAEMVKFTKNGSSATTGAIKLARAFTGREIICVPRQQPFFSFDDWFIASTVTSRGIPQSTSGLTMQFDFNDINSLQELFRRHPKQIACVIMEPATALLPCSSECDPIQGTTHKCQVCIFRSKNFLVEVQELCHHEGALFILDEMITGFRWNLLGAQEIFGVSPDLTTFGKAMANGFSLSALTGRREIMELGGISRPGLERTFLLSTTHGAEMTSLGAFLATLEIHRSQDVCQHLWRFGSQLKTLFRGLIAEANLSDFIAVKGPDISLEYITLDLEGQPSLEFRTLFMQEMVKHGILFSYLAPSLSHGESELQLTEIALRKTLAVYFQALKNGISGYLEGPAIKPVFRKIN